MCFFYEYFLLLVLEFIWYLDFSCPSVLYLVACKRHLQYMHEFFSVGNFQADKDFVWSLWKRLQVSNPDVTEAISLVIQRYCKVAQLFVQMLWTAS